MAHFDPKSISLASPEIAAYPKRYDARKGKFIRYGGLIVVAPFCKTNLIFHKNLVDWLNNKENSDVLEAEKESIGMNDKQRISFAIPLHDAGLLRLVSAGGEGIDHLDDVTLPESRPDELLVVHGQSEGFGSGQEAARIQTANNLAVAVNMPVFTSDNVPHP